MIRLLGLKWLILLTFTALGVGLVTGYSLLTAHYYVSGMDNIVAGQLGRAAMQSVAFEMGIPAPREEYIVTRAWAQQPRAIREAFAQPPQQPETLYKAYTGGEGAQDRLYFATWHVTPAGDRFVTQQLVALPQTREQIISPAQNRLINLTLIGLGSALMIALVIVLLWRRVSRPITALSNWAAALNERNLNEPVPDFIYPELNHFAELMRNSLSSAQQGLEREQTFLSHTSHELRTPISVVRANLELLRKIQGNTAVDPRQAEIVSRIDRASLTMKDVTETLLWLGRDDTAPRAIVSLRLDQVIGELVEGLRYLVQGRPVDLHLDLEPATLELPEAPTRIVLGNLIRNALQHTPAGEVQIIQRGGQVQIINSPGEASNSADTGFGLGLKLTERFTEKLGWDYRNEPSGNGRHVEIRLATPLSSVGEDDHTVLTAR